MSAEELRTIICELAAVINDRPLSYIGSDAEAPRALTPAMFLRGGPDGGPLCAVAPLDRLGPNGSTVNPPPEARELQRAITERTTYFRALSVRWYREYLLLLRSAHTELNGRASAPLQVGDVCLVKDDNAARIKWNLARIQDAHTGRDGVVRTYTIRFANGHLTRRAAQLLIPLEVHRQP